MLNYKLKGIYSYNTLTKSSKFVFCCCRDEDRKKLEETLETVTKQKEEIEKKWKTDFEKLRTVNILKEQELLDDFEWKLREVQQTCKKKLDDKEKLIEERLQEAYKEAGQKMEEAQKMLGQVS